MGSSASTTLDLQDLLALAARAQDPAAALPPALERFLTALDGSEGGPTDGDERLRALAAGAVRAGADEQGSADDRLEDLKAVRPATSFTSYLVPGGLLTFGGGTWSVLGPHELALLDVVVRRTTPTTAVRLAAERLGADADPEHLRAALARLVAHHRLMTRRPSVEAEGRPFAERLTPETRAHAGLASRPVRRPGAEDRIPVWAPWDEHDLPLGLAMVTARAREDDAVSARYDVHPPQRAADVAAEMATHEGHAVLLCSNYMWTKHANLSFARWAKAQNPELLVVHGGPATPKYEDDERAFFLDGGDAVHVAIRGEGEDTLVEALAAVRPDGDWFDLTGLREVDGLSCRDPVEADRIVRTGDRERIAVLDELPSPYLVGDFEHLYGTAGTVETNRGCPYGCTFCDWGSATLSRVRKFDLDRVESEMRWMAARHIDDWTIGDANFGIFPRDVEVAERIVAIKRETGYPERLAFCLAKNTTRHLVKIVDLLTEVGVACHCSLSLQTRDPATLAAVDRRNIKTDHYTELANSFRRTGLPLLADLMLGLPGQTVDSYRIDLQFLFDLDVPTRTWPTQVLPNAPLNAPEYRAEHGVVVDERGLLVATSSFTAEDRDQMLRIRLAAAALEHFGLLRHVLRFLQWDHHLPATEVMVRMLDVTESRPHQYPLLGWVLRWFDVHTVPPVGWPAFYAEVRAFVVDELEVEGSSALDVVLRVQQHLMPDLGRRFPDVVALEHDVVTYEQDATRWFWDDSAPVGPSRPLGAHGPATLEVWGDPNGFCSTHLGEVLGNRSETDITSFWTGDHWELDSPLTRNVAEVARDLRYRSVVELRDARALRQRPQLTVTAAPA